MRVRVFYGMGVLAILMFVLPASATLYDFTSSANSTVAISGTLSDMSSTTESSSASGLFDVLDYQVEVDTSSQTVSITSLELAFAGPMQFNFPTFGQTVQLKDINLQMGPTASEQYTYDSEKDGYFFDICDDTDITATSSVNAGSGWESDSRTIGAKIVDSQVLFDGSGNVTGVTTHFVGGWWDYDSGVWQSWNIQGIVTVVPEPASIGLILLAFVGVMRRRK